MLLIICCLFICYLLKLTTPKDHQAVSYPFTFLSEKLISRCVFSSHAEEPAFALGLYFSVSTSASGKQVFFAQRFYFRSLFRPSFLSPAYLPTAFIQAFQKCTIASLYYFLTMASFLAPQLYSYNTISNQLYHFQGLSQRACSHHSTSIPEELVTQKFAPH